MSDNTYIYLTWIKDHYEISHRDSDNPNNEFSLRTAKTLYEAIKRARKLQNEVWPEYGITIGSLKREVK